MESGTCSPRPVRCIIHCVDNSSSAQKQAEVSIVIASTGGRGKSIGSPYLTEPQNSLNPLAISKLLQFLNLNWTEPPIPLFTFSPSLPPLSSHPALKPCCLYGIGIFLQCFHGYWWHVSVGSEPVSGNVTPSFRPVSLQLLSGRGWGHRDIWMRCWGGVGCCNYMCIRRGLEQLGRVILAAFVILVSAVGGSCEDTGVLPRD